MAFRMPRIAGRFSLKRIADHFSLYNPRGNPPKHDENNQSPANTGTNEVDGSGQDQGNQT